ncbi:MAG: hypothetical protein HC918_10065 [Oscillatoriales cyanobacterium SM2_1_8]|nr:hypothetical protein [Oscillatoriales cyanobacterium SM2_1_8]
MRVRLTLSLLAIALVPLLILGIVGDREVTRRLQTETQTRLVEVATSRVRELETYFRTLQTAVGAIAQSPTVAALLTAPPDATTARRRFQGLLSVYTESVPYQDALLLAPTGAVQLALRPNPYPNAAANPQLQEAFAQATTLLEATISDWGRDPQTAEVSLFVSAPVLGEKGVLGAVVLRVSNRTLQRLVNQYGGLGRTGETLVLADLAGKPTFLAATRHDPDAAFRTTIDAQTPPAVARPITEAIAGTSGVGLVPDYRGVMTLAAWRYLPSLNGAAVVKIDAAELWAPIDQLRRLGLGFLGLTAIAVGLVATALAKALTNPPSN